MAIMIAGVQPASQKATGAAAGKASSKTGDFGAMIAASLSKQNSYSNDLPSAAQPKAEVADKPAVQQQKVEANAKEIAGSEEPAKEAAVEQTVQKEPESGPEELEGNPEEGALEKVIREVFQNIKDAIKDILNMDDEELSLLMEQMGIVMADLINPQVLQELVVQANGGGDVSLLLTDASLYDAVQQLQNQVEGILQEAEVTPEDIATLQADAKLPEDFAQAAQVLEPTPNEQPDGKESAKKVETANAKAPDAESGKLFSEKEENAFQFEAVREVSKTGQESSRQSQSSSDGISKPEQFMNLVANAASEGEAEAEVIFSRLSPAEQIREIADQILEKVRIVLNPAQTSMEITLNPESLGRVSLNLISKQGIMTAHFAAQNQLAREAIESQMPILRESLENQGIKVEAIEVTVSNFEFTQSDGAGRQGQEGKRSQQRRNLTIEEAGFMEEVTEEEAIAIDMLERSGNSVDYTA